MINMQRLKATTYMAIAIEGEGMLPLLDAKPRFKPLVVHQNENMKKKFFLAADFC